MLYGNLPTDLGLVNIAPKEMMFHMYMPISLPGSDRVYLPEHLEVFRPLIVMAWQDERERFKNEYVYLTAKTLWVSGEYIGNRPGWHSDGFGTNDINYIWADRAPTDFLYDTTSNGFEFDGVDCEAFYATIKEYVYPFRGHDDQFKHRQDGHWPWYIKQYADNHLLKLDPSVIHRSPVGFEEGMRSFAKVSISPDQYNLEGNASNYLLDIDWKMKPRNKERNHPSM